MEGIKEGSTEPTSSSVGTDCTENEVPTQQLQTDAARETRVESDAVVSLQEFGEASVSTYSFWKGSFVAALLGAGMGLLALAFSWCMYACLCNWIFTLSYKHAVLSTQFTPKSYWIWLPTLGSLAIGAIKLLPLGRYSYPSNVHGSVILIYLVYLHTSICLRILFFILSNQPLCFLSLCACLLYLDRLFFSSQFLSQAQFTRSEPVRSARCSARVMPEHSHWCKRGARSSVRMDELCNSAIIYDCIRPWDGLLPKTWRCSIY